MGAEDRVAPADASAALAYEEDGAVERLVPAEVVREVVAPVEVLLHHRVVDGAAVHVDPAHAIGVDGLQLVQIDVGPHLAVAFHLASEYGTVDVGGIIRVGRHLSYVISQAHHRR